VTLKTLVHESDKTENRSHGFEFFQTNVCSCMILFVIVCWPSRWLHQNRPSMEPFSICVYHEQGTQIQTLGA